MGAPSLIIYSGWLWCHLHIDYSLHIALVHALVCMEENIGGAVEGSLQGIGLLVAPISLECDGNAACRSAILLEMVVAHKGEGKEQLGIAFHFDHNWNVTRGFFRT